MRPRFPSLPRIRYRSQCRHYALDSNHGRVYHPKVYAWPFEISAKTAERRIMRYLTAPPAVDSEEFGQRFKDAKQVFAVAKARIDTALPIRREETIAKWRDTWHGSLREAFRDLGTVQDGIREGSQWTLERIAGMYLPTWIVRCRIDIRCGLNGGQLAPRSFGLLDGIIPAHGHAPLAKLLLSEPHTPPYVPRPFGKEMLTTVWGDKVEPIRYTVSPFKLVEQWRKALNKSSALTQDELTLSSDLKLSQVCLVPMLHPVYVASFTLPIISRNITLILPAIDRHSAWFGLFSSKEPTLYRPRPWSGPISSTAYYSPETESAENIKLVSLSEESDGTDSDEETIRHKLSSLLIKWRQSRVDWKSIGGLNERVWVDDRIVSYYSDEWAHWSQRAFDNLK